ncbi:hypothetical protein KIN20_022282 [Parelaphostrongylus tenuis]|uniref:Uncharacterized protein n=1 Tax=Parelaphostrongylus tenuis TaxID=148309 RepID=A0AAD5QWP1_PARTN|nr:hypothetical protein KIN20_022282 [Parelaphostrongylus tenuis]
MMKGVNTTPRFLARIITSSFTITTSYSFSLCLTNQVNYFCAGGLDRILKTVTTCWCFMTILGTLEKLAIEVDELAARSFDSLNSGLCAQHFSTAPRFIRLSSLALLSLTRRLQHEDERLWTIDSNQL